MIPGLITQDTTKPAISVRIRPGNLIPDSIFRKMDEVPDRLKSADPGAVKKQGRSLYQDYIVTDTTTVCGRNIVSDLTFSDSLNFVAGLDTSKVIRFPFNLPAIDARARQGRKEVIIMDLKDGQELPKQLIPSDWVLGVIFSIICLFLIVRSTSKNLMPGIGRFLLFRDINEPSSKDISSLFYWQSTLLNFITFLSIALFVYCGTVYYGIAPTGIPGFLFLLICFAMVAAAVTLRHIVCFVAGSLSGQKEVFREYLIGVYNSYRFSSIFISFFGVMMLYTFLLPADIWLTAGYILLGFMYLNRVIRLFLIFLKRNIPILYLILYLCALEILPVLILIKYFSGLG